MSFETAHIENNKGYQGIRIPANVRIHDDKVYLKKVGNTLYVIPFHNPWENLVGSLQDFTTDFMQDRDQSETQKREALD